MPPWVCSCQRSGQKLGRCVWDSVPEPGGHHLTEAGPTDPPMPPAGTASPHYRIMSYSSFFRIICLTLSPVTESNRRPSPYHAHLFCRMVSRWVELPQFEAMGGSGCVVLCLLSAGGVVTWFVTEQSDVGGVWPGYAKPRSRSRRPRSNRATSSGSTGGCPSESQHGGLVRGCSGSSMPSAAYNSR
jgi:hypothetical protein